jgi:hypothetical protein
LWQKELGRVAWEPGLHDRGLPTVGHYEDETYWLETSALHDPAKRPKHALSAAVAAGWPGMTWVLPTALMEEGWDEYDDYIDDDDDDMGAEYDPETDKLIEVPREDPFEPFRLPPWKGSPTPVGICFPEGMTVTGGHIDQVAKVPNLRGLSLDTAYAEPGVLPRVARIKSLEHLDLGDELLNDTAVRTLAPLKKLRTLLTNDSNISNAGAAELAKFKELRTLRLPTRRLTAAGYQALAKLTKLEDLVLEKADDAALWHLAPLSRLRRLHLNGTNVTGRGIENFPLLTELILDSTRADNAGMVGVTNLPRLRVLGLDSTRITGVILPQLAGLRWLEELYLGDTAITDKDLVHLEGMKGLVELSIWNTRVTKKGAAKLQNKLKKSNVWR